MIPINLPQEQRMTAELKAWSANWQREREGAYLYGELEKLARTPEMQRALGQMAQQEEKHAGVWAERARQANPRVRAPGSDLRIRLTLLLARLFGAESVLGLLINDEVSDIASYTDQAMSLGDKATYQTVLMDETAHARTLA